MSPWARLRRLWTSSLRRQLVIGIAAVHAVMMTLLLVDLVGRQHAFLDDDVETQAVGIAQGVAAASTSWVLASDVEGLAEVIDGMRRYPSVVDVMVLSPELKVLGHSDRARVGEYLDDPLSLSMRGAPLAAQTLSRGDDVMDGVAPVLGAGGRHLGWARVRLGLAKADLAVAAARRSGLRYALGAIALGVVFALLMAAGLTRDLRRLVDVTDGVRRGEQRRSAVRREDELGRLSDELNRMLDVLHAQSQAQEHLRRALEEGAQLKEQLKHAQKMEALGRLAGGVAHDFNNLLTVINTHLDLARRNAADPQLREDLDDALAAGARARDVVAEVLAFSRDRVTEREPVELGEVSAEAVRLVAATAHGTAMKTEAHGPHWVAGSPTNLHRVVMNLCANARNALAGHGAVTVRVGRRRVQATCASCRLAAEGEFVEVAVEDDGPGIGPDVLEHMFEPFFTTRRSAGGTGLGLAMVHGVVHSHDGHLLVSSRPGSTRISVLLPPGEAPPAAATATPAPAASAGCGHLLVVDDEPMVARALVRMLKQAGFTVAVEGTAPGGLERATREPFLAVITDNAMPDMTGLELARQLRARGLTVPILLCTGGDLELCDCFGVTAVLHKPVEAADLVRTLAGLPHPTA